MAEKAIREAKSYKMRWWQFSKRDYIRDYEKKQEAGTSK